MTRSTESDFFGPWNPGIESRLPVELLPRMTLLRPENAFTDVKLALELAAFTGLRPGDLARLRPERLVVHELLIRVSADFLVPDGFKYEDLGINARAMVTTIFEDYVAPHMPSITAAYEDLTHRTENQVNGLLSASLFASAATVPNRVPTKPRGFLERLGLKTPLPAGSEVVDSREQKELRAMAAWRRQGEAADDDLIRACCRALQKVAAALYTKHGGLQVDQTLLARLATDRVLNNYGSEMIGRLIEPFIEQARTGEGYRRLPAQTEPVIMNTKGASAAGKSTMRPLQRRLAARLGVDWEDFALISPDIWRKYLLDYDSLGSHYKYAGTLTGDEVAIIDRKLDRHMSAKAAQGRMSHLVIDRFRFDSFDPEAPSGDGSNLLTRFGRVVYMFFIITPPHATVERAWARGLKVGRFKAVDDLLDHNVEAFTGIPRLFFTWASHRDMSVHFEFLDNSVPQGQLPRTIAYGFNGELNILDVKGMLNIDRYSKININAHAPGQVYPRAETMAAGRNTAFVRQCARRIPAINFIDARNACIYAHMQAGRLQWIDPDLFAQAIKDEEIRATFASLAPEVLEGRWDAYKSAVRLDTSDVHTLGQWQAPS